jgi:hypothetical protein
MISIPRTTAVLALAVGTLVPVVAAPSAMASSGSHGGGGTRVQASGSCTGGGTWTLRAKADDGALEVEYEVDTNVTGQAWKTTITDNGATIYRATRTTRAPSGSFEAQVRTANRAGKDVIRAVATHAGRTCTGSVTS